MLVSLTSVNAMFSLVNTVVTESGLRPATLFKKDFGAGTFL